MRHAKSSWAIPGARDFDRELNDRGFQDLVKMSNFIKKQGITPDKILCSSAIRTRQTVDSIIDAFAVEPDITYTERLYSSGVSEYIEIINSLENAKSLMIIGHNPMCGTLATILPNSSDSDEFEKIAYKYPTAALSIINFEFESWAEVTKASGHLEKSIFPSQL